jgi:uncharacterized protein YjbJ (UPF0337 family)
VNPGIQFRSHNRVGRANLLPDQFSHLSNFDQTAAGPPALLDVGKILNDGARSVRGVRQRHLTQEEETMNANQLKGKWMQFKGELKQWYGKFTDDALQQIGGNYEKFIGKV